MVRKPFVNPKIVHCTRHVSGLAEVGIGYGKEIYYLLSRRSFMMGEISTHELDVLFNEARGINILSDQCYCCKGDCYSKDRGIPLCQYHQEKQDRINLKRKTFFPGEYKWDQKDPEDIIFG